MFQRLPERGDNAGEVSVEIDGRSVRARAGDTVAAVLLASDLGWTRRTPISGAPRAPYCMMGVCFECLVEIDGATSQQACLVRVRDGMRIRRKDGRPEIGA